MSATGGAPGRLGAPAPPDNSQAQTALLDAEQVRFIVRPSAGLTDLADMQIRCPVLEQQPDPEPMSVLPMGIAIVE